MGLGFRAQGLNSGPWTLNLNKLQTLKSQQCSRQPFTHLDTNRNHWWDKGKIYFGEKISQDFVMPDALPSPGSTYSQCFLTPALTIFAVVEHELQPDFI
jgi:hypothetical protein